MPAAFGRPRDDASEYTSLEICAGAGGQALGLERAGFGHVALFEVEPWAAATLRANRPRWDVRGPAEGERAVGFGGPGDVHLADGREFRGRVDLFAGGVPCPPFSAAGKQLGPDDERDLFPRALDLIEQIQPRAVMLENVRGLRDAKFAEYRASIVARLQALGFSRIWWEVLEAADFGVPQLRPRSILVALQPDAAPFFTPPVGDRSATPTVGETCLPLMAAEGWEGAAAWAGRAGAIAPTLVGGSRKHGGADLGPTRARAQWAKLSVDGRGLANHAPLPGERNEMPRLTVEMTALIQGFPPEWHFAGRKTAMYRQIGNAFPPPVAEAVGVSIRQALAQADELRGTRGVQLAA